MLTLLIRQGEDCALVVGDLEDGAGQPFNPTGWVVHAMARPHALSSVLWQEWATDPAGEQGAARVVSRDVTPEGGGDPVTVHEVELDVTHAMSSAWTWAGQTGVLHVEATEPGPEPEDERRRARIGERRIYLDPETVR